jgi:hypothetical protein
MSYKIRRFTSLENLLNLAASPLDLRWYYFFLFLLEVYLRQNNANTKL